MDFLKTKKELIIEIFLITLICILASILLFFYIESKAVETSSNTNTSLNVNVSNSESNDDITAVLNNTSNEADNQNDIPEIVTDEKASEKELKEEKVTKKEEKKATSPYYIKVNYKANVVTIYKKDKNDKYTIPYKAMVCSCGTYTPKSGTYKTTNKYRWGKLIHDVYGQYATRIVGSILFHSVPYSSNTNDTLLYNQYDKLGTTASAGCIRLTVKDAKWIYDNCPKGTMVEFYSDSNPGPLGKPTSQKISSVEECRDWDPTDPAAGNPWHTYKPEEENTVPDTPTTDLPTTDVPTTDNPNTNTPSTDLPDTNTPSTDTPSTGNPSVDEPSTPDTNEPDTDEPSTDVPNTDQPTTDQPTTDEPSTDIPTTDEPSPNVPTTNTISTSITTNI